MAVYPRHEPWRETENAAAMPQPPIGLEPRWHWLESRRAAIVSALARYVVAGYEPPDVWIDELYSLAADLRRIREQRNVPEQAP